MRRILLALMLVVAPIIPARAEVTIAAAEIAQGDLQVKGKIDEPNTTIMLDESFSGTSDAEGRFAFRIAYHPATCTVLLKTETQSRAVVVANCGQRGPPGPEGPPGPGHPASGGAPLAERPSLTNTASAIGTACGPNAALYEGEKGFKLWVTRKGSVLAENPLRPLTRETTLVLQVTINGKVASAYGPEFGKLVRGGPPELVEEALGNKIVWENANDSLPAMMQVVSDTGATVLARLRFRECGVAPAAASPDARAKPERRPPSPDPAKAIAPASRDAAAPPRKPDQQPTAPAAKIASPDGNAAAPGKAEPERRRLEVPPNPDEPEAKPQRRSERARSRPATKPLTEEAPPSRPLPQGAIE